MHPRQHDMGSHVADDMGIVSDVGRAWIGCPSIGFDGCALSQVGGDKTVQRGGGKVVDCCEANAAGRAVGDFDRAGDEHFALGERPPPPLIGSSLARKGISVSSISAIPARSARAGATMARRSLAHNSQADL